MPKLRHGQGYTRMLDDGNGRRHIQLHPILVVKDPSALTGALLCGAVLVTCADVMVKPAVELGKVRRVLAGWAGPEYEFNAVFPRGHGQSPKVRAFVDFLLERLNLEIDYMSEHCPLMAARCGGTHAAAAEAGEQAEHIAAGKRILETVTAD